MEGKEGIFRRDTGGMGIEGIKEAEAQRGPLWIYTVG